MKIALFDTHRFEREFFTHENLEFGHEINFLETRLTRQTADLVQDAACVCAFVNDRLDREVLSELHSKGVRLIALRSAGFNHVDLQAAKELKLPVVRVPEYSPYAVAEHAVGLMLCLNRQIHRAYNRVREGNFSLDGLVGFDLHKKTVGVIGTGRIGSVMCQILAGFGCQILAYDQTPSAGLKVHYTSLEEIYRQSDIITLHLPLTQATRHMISSAAFSQMKRGVMLINTGRGALIDTLALIQSLKSGHLGYAGLDVYEEEESMFFQNHSNEIIQDDVLARLLTFPNVVMTSHQAFLTREALTAIARITLGNIAAFEKGSPLVNSVGL